MKTFRSMTAMILAIACLCCLAACGSTGTEQTQDPASTLGLPTFDRGVAELVSDNKMYIHDITAADFEPYIQFLQENGFTYNCVDSKQTPEDVLIKNQMWQGKKDDVAITVFLMLDIQSMSNYISVEKVAG